MTIPCQFLTVSLEHPSGKFPLSNALVPCGIAKPGDVVALSLTFSVGTTIACYDIRFSRLAADGSIAGCALADLSQEEAARIAPAALSQVQSDVLIDAVAKTSNAYSEDVEEWHVDIVAGAALLSPEEGSIYELWAEDSTASSEIEGPDFVQLLVQEGMSNHQALKAAEGMELLLRTHNTFVSNLLPEELAYGLSGDAAIEAAVVPHFFQVDR